jgi:cell division protein FtsQ
MSANPRLLHVPDAPAPASLSRTLMWCASLALIAAALLPLVPKLAGAHAPVTLEIAGELSRVEAEQVRHVVSGRLNAEFYALDLGSLKAAVEAMPWVARARVERAWPAAVRVHLWEHQPYARWGEHSLLSTENVVFTPPALDDDVLRLPKLNGPAGQQAAVRAAWEVLSQQLAPTPFAPAGLIENERGEWLATTTDGIELRLGRGTPLDAVARLAGPVRTALEGRLQEVSYVDLHYFNGFAVGWRDDRGGAAGVTRLAQGSGHE